MGGGTLGRLWSGLAEFFGGRLRNPNLPSLLFQVFFIAELEKEFAFDLFVSYE